MSFTAKKPRRTNAEMKEALDEVSKERTTRLNVEVPESNMKLLKKIVAEKGVTIREYVNDALEAKMKRDANNLNVQ